jgi:high-affinity K+ transport system ATPase subunit B
VARGLIANALIGIVQELRAKRALDGLNILTARKARVFRAGQIQDLPVAAIVVDDVVEIGAGDQITTDGVRLQSEALAQPSAMPVISFPRSNPQRQRHVISYSNCASATKQGGYTHY